ncbi:hypothetical protein L7F22_000774 [Adiantum nelumboides]|nr:hypothetical protein [Adiantum nelumboides]
MKSCPKTKQCSTSNPDKGKQAVRVVRDFKVVSALMLNANTNVSVPVNSSNQVLSLLGFVNKHPLNVLVDSGCSTNFVSTMLVNKLRLPTQQSVEAFQVELADGSYLECNKKVQQLEFLIQDYQDHLGFLASWEEYLPLVEFAYNNAPHSITGMTPFQAAYDHTPLVPTNFVLHHIVALVDQLVQEMQDILVQIIKKNSLVSYKLELPPSWGKLHPTFHISWLKQYIQGDSPVPGLSSHEPKIEDEHVILVLEMILDVRQKETRRKLTTEFLVKWMDLDESDSTWQTDEEMQQYPNLLQEFFDKR